MSELEHQHLVPSRTRQVVAENWRRVRDEVAGAAVAAGRQPEQVRIVGVTKYVDAVTAAALAWAGCTDLGENRPQSLWDKAQWFEQHWPPATPESPAGPESPGEPESPIEAVRWHMIGHLQRNKARRTVPLLSLMHSLDSLRLVETVGQEAARAGGTLDVLLEVNVTGDEEKTGIPPEQAPAVIEAIQAQDALRLCGVMGMAGLGTSGDQSRGQFEKIRSLRDTWQSQYGILLPELSMGMSGDFAEAIAAGATLVRIGSRLFEGL
ncbi:YggS family pyridoxal phosphate-dependent enzyme [Roseimaritima sediminicola]|uniref:YggS family pyridoxal phosphate-dependent enzyme n=1 Tax=Roseimaritima sediminicola TaxID=2662066 RepID=UPI0012982C15|nr:YggS family pyridoxal phosphate-dependent enzyme [Roseimaritima sediminicola]